MDGGRISQSRRDTGYTISGGYADSWRFARRYLAPVFLLASFLIGGCDAIPRDSAGTLERVRGGELRVGVAENPPWVRFEGSQVTGLEPDLIQEWAEKVGARVRFQRGSEADLVEALHRRELDVMAAGLDSKTPYAPRLAPTQPYVDVEDRHGKKKKHILAVSQGENALLLSLDRFLAAQNKLTLRRRAHQEQWKSGQTEGDQP
jgi:membrane-bound lytic murein transglycosylase MltF